MHGIVDVFAVEVGFRLDVDNRFKLLFRRLSRAPLLDRLVKKLRVHLEADARDVTVLLCTKEVPRAANLKVAHGDLETCAQLGKLLHRLQTLFRHLGQDLVGLIDEIGKRHVIRPADAAAHLIELRQTEAIGVVYDDRVRVRHVETVFHNARRKQDVVAPLVEIDHDALQKLFRHLPVPRLNPRLRHELFKPSAHDVDALDAVVDEVNLPATSKFAANGILQDSAVVLDDVALHGEALGGRRLDDAHVTRSDERHVKRPRNRRRRKRQYVYARREFLDLLLLLDAEALLLVDDQKPEVGKMHALLIQDGVRADEHVDLVRLQTLDRRLLLLRRAKAADDVDAHAEISEACGKRLEVLLCKHGRRHEHGDLLMIHDRLVGGADRHLRLAEADIAAEQAIHRLGLFHIRLDLLNGAALVGRLLIREGVLELPLPRRIGGKCEALRRAALRVERDEFVGDVLDGSARARLRLDPLRAAHAVQTRRLALRSDVFLQESHLIGRHEELVVAAVLDVQIVFLDAAHIERFDTQILADAMIHMDDVIADVDLAEVCNTLFLRGFLREFLLLPAEDVLFGHDNESRPGQFEAVRERAHHDVQISVAQRLVARCDSRWYARLREKLAQGSSLLRLADEKDDVLLVGKPVSRLILQKIHLPLEGSDCLHSQAHETVRLRAVNLLQHEGGEEGRIAFSARHKFFP